MKKSLITSLLVFICTTIGYSQTTISGTINTYAQVTNISGSVFTIGTPAGAGGLTEFNAGKLVLIYQAKGATINTNADATAGQVSSLNNAGNFEIATVQSRSGSNITFSSLSKSYTLTGQVQLVSIPNYTYVKNNGTLTSVEWDSTNKYGGIIALKARKLELGANINANGAGFRGGAQNPTGNGGGCTTVYHTSSTIYGYKGEGFALTPTNRYGQGRVGNGGGGACTHNGGGGGGANFGTGGKGGDGWPGAGCTPANSGGGLGGESFDYSASSAKIFFGGGGGGGQQNNNAGSNGNDGGGIIILIADTVTTDCGSNYTVSANGNNASASSANDGAGGAGAGGVVLINTTYYNPAVCNITFSANGGNGGSINYGDSHGGGGGGGTGAILSNIPPPTNIIFSSSPGANGTDCTSCSPETSSSSSGDEPELDYQTSWEIIVDGATAFESVGPAGISSDILLWLKANEGVVDNSAKVTHWQDQGGRQFTFSQANSGNQPTIITSGASLMNGNPVLDFDGTDDFLENADLENSINGLTGLTFIAVAKSDITGSHRTLFDADNGSATTDDYVYMRYRSTSNTIRCGIGRSGANKNYTSQINIQTTDPQLLSMHYSNGNSLTMYINNNALTNATVPNSPQSSAISGITQVTLGDGSYNAWNGKIAEVILYGAEKNATDRQKIMSYLAIKYGISMDQTSAQDYLAPDGTVIFPATTTYVAFKNDIAGIGNDFRSALNQSASQSTSADGLVLVSDASSLGDGDYLVWGNNDEDNSNWTYTDSISPGYARIDREWRFKATGDIGTITIAIDTTKLPAVVAGQTWILAVDADGTFSTGPTLYSTSTISNGYRVFSGVSIADGNYLTIGKAGKATAMSGNYTSPSTWIDGKAPVEGEDIIISTGNSITLTANTVVGSIVLQNSTSALNLAGFTLTINSGSLNNLGTITHGNGTVAFTGTEQQYIKGDCDFYNLTVTNSLGVVVGSGDQTIQGSLTITAGTFTTNNSVTILSNASGTGRIGDLTNGNISGDVKMQRYITGDMGWRSIGAPLEGATIFDWQNEIITSGFPNSNYPSYNFNNIYYYDEDSLGTFGVGFVPATDANNPIVLGRGYYIYTYPATGIFPFTTDITGTVYKGNFSFDVQFTDWPGVDNTNDDGWNFLCNPYPSTIDWNAGSWTKTNIDNAIYIWDKAANGGLGAMRSYINGSGTNGGTNLIASSQSFYVHANNTSPVLTITETCKSSSEVSFARQQNNSNNEVRLKIKDNIYPYEDEIVIKLDANATNSYDGQYDALKLAGWEASLPYLASSIDSVEFAINTMNLTTYPSTIPLNITVGYAGNFTLNALDIANQTLFSCLQLEDMKTGATTNLLADTSYAFTYTLGDVNPRFILHVNTALSTIMQETSCFGANDGSIEAQVNSQSASVFSWTNALGTILKQDTAFTSIISGLSAGSYTVNITTTNAFCPTSSQSVDVVETPEIIAQFNAVDLLIDIAHNATVSFINNSSNATSYLWNFGDGNTSTAQSPTHTYSTEGTFVVTLTATNTNGCDTTFSQQITVLNTTGISDLVAENGISMYQTSGQLIVNVSDAPFDGEIQCLDLTGKEVWKTRIKIDNQTSISLKPLSSGIYLIRLTSNSEEIISRKIFVD